MNQIPSPPSDTPDKPDRYTNLVNDQTGPSARDRTFYLNLGVLRFGTNDKIQGAAILLAIFILIAYILILLVSINSIHSEITDSILDKAVAGLWNVFLLAIGVALGRGINSQHS